MDGRNRRAACIHSCLTVEPMNNWGPCPPLLMLPTKGDMSIVSGPRITRPDCQLYPPQPLPTGSMLTMPKPRSARSDCQVYPPKLRVSRVETKDNKA